MWHCVNILDYMMSFVRYKQEFGFIIPDRPIIIDDVRIRGIGRAGTVTQMKLPEAQGFPTALEVSGIFEVYTIRIVF